MPNMLDLYENLCQACFQTSYNFDCLDCGLNFTSVKSFSDLVYFKVETK